MILKTFVVVFFAVFLFNELSGPRMSSADFGVVEKNGAINLDGVR